jgi:FkbM family methyltransferase
VYKAEWRFRVVSGNEHVHHPIEMDLTAERASGELTAGLRRAIYRTFIAAASLPLQIGFPGRWAFIAAFINNSRYEQHWNGAALRWVRGKVHGYSMPCDLSVFSGRSAYFMRRWYEADTQSVLLTLLKPGDLFIDIGANVGMAALTGAKAVRSAGRVIAFEPNPRVAAVLAECVARNDLKNVTIHVAAFGPEPGRLPFFVPASNHGEGSLGTAFGDRAGREIEVEVVGPTSLAELTGCRVVKIDVEGFEAKVLEGLTDLIQRFRPVIVTEVEPIHLKRCGSSVAELFDRLASLGYVGFAYHEAPLGTFKLHAALQRVQAPADLTTVNMLWAPTEDADRIASTEFVGVPR